MCHAIQLLVCECKLLLVLFRLANLTIVIIFLQFSPPDQYEYSSFYAYEEYYNYIIILYYYKTLYLNKVCHLSLLLAQVNQADQVLEASFCKVYPFFKS
ncbi:hypothetical protein EI94DRAFT_1743043 [Lactarius quietus]|nr:hypothetical protein EI94DRAFT_1743043 [Lactarius quietus]